MKQSQDSEEKMHWGFSDGDGTWRNNWKDSALADELNAALLDVEDRAAGSFEKVFAIVEQLLQLVEKDTEARLKGQ